MTVDQIMLVVSLGLFSLLIMGAGFAGYLEGRRLRQIAERHALRREVRDAGRDLPLRVGEHGSPQWVGDTMDTLAVEGALLLASERLR